MSPLRATLPWIAIGVACLSTGAAATARLNILFVVADDLNCDVACYGASGMVTPNIDRLASGVVELLDLYPTLAELCGLRPPGYLEGTSLVPVLNDPGREIKTAAFSQLMRRATGRQGYSLRTGRWRYTEWDGDGGVVRQLFDEEADPAETTDLAARPEHAPRVAEFQILLSAQRAHGR